MKWYLRIHANKAPVRLGFLRRRAAQHPDTTWRDHRVKGLHNTSPDFWNGVLPNNAPVWMDYELSSPYVRRSTAHVGLSDFLALTGLLPHGRYIAGYCTPHGTRIWVNKIFMDEGEAVSYGRVLAREAYQRS